MILESVHFSGKRTAIGNNSLEIAKPSGADGAITIICGRNHSGKSFILKKIYECILKLNEKLDTNEITGTNSIQVENVTCIFSESSMKHLKSALIYDVSYMTEMTKDASPVKDSSLKRKISKPLGKEKFTRTDHYIQIITKNCFEKFRVSCLIEYENFKEPFNSDLFIKDDKNDYREKILGEIPDNKLFITPRKSDIVKAFENLTKGMLYYGVTKRRGKSLPTFQVYIVFNGQSTIPYHNWSDGQKVLFSFLIMLYYEKPSVLLFDEIENHLHPEYISAALEFSKQYAKQTIITTHHPHIIFSKHIDSVNFLEVHNHNIQTYPQSVIDFNRDASAKIPIRENILLKHGYSKLLSTYKLFDTYDTQLLRLSSLAISNFNEILADIFLSMFKYEVKKENFRPDIQSEQLHKILVNKIENSENENIKILEYGTGEGRMFKNVSKISNRKNVEKAHWFLYEPMMTQRKLLRENYELTLSNIFEIPETLPDAKFDIIFLANVLHELSPNAIAETLSYSASHLMKDGIIVIIELHPLLNPEKYSVSLAANEWSNLAMKLGFSVYSGQIPIKNSMHEAYFVKLSLKQNQLYEEKILEKRISNFWKTQILKNRIGEYDGGQDITDIEEIGKTLRLLTTITSITAYSTGLWDSKSKIE